MVAHLDCGDEEYRSKTEYIKPVPDTEQILNLTLHTTELEELVPNLIQPEYESYGTEDHELKVLSMVHHSGYVLDEGKLHEVDRYTCKDHIRYELPNDDAPLLSIPVLV